MTTSVQVVSQTDSTRGWPHGSPVVLHPNRRGTPRGCSRAFEKILGLARGASSRTWGPAAATRSLRLSSSEPAAKAAPAQVDRLAAGSVSRRPRIADIAPSTMEHLY